jgi:hypothetical protein
VILASLLALQAVGQTVVAVKNDAPETWTVEYPRLIQPFVQDYRRCLVVTNRKVSGKPDFEEQHRADLPRCAAAFAQAEAEANRVLANRGEAAEFSPADVREVLDHVGRIHIARGADLDHQFRQRMAGAEAASTAYEANRPKGLVIELRDASVVKAATDASAAAAKKDKDGQ